MRLFAHGQIREAKAQAARAALKIITQAEAADG